MDPDLKTCIDCIIGDSNDDNSIRSMFYERFARNQHELMNLSEADYERMKDVKTVYSHRYITAGAINRIRKFVEDVVLEFWDVSEDDTEKYYEYVDYDRRVLQQRYESKIIAIIDKRMRYEPKCQCVVSQI